MKKYIVRSLALSDKAIAYRGTDKWCEVKSYVSLEEATKAINLFLKLDNKEDMLGHYAYTIKEKETRI